MNEACHSYITTRHVILVCWMRQLHKWKKKKRKNKKNQMPNWMPSKASLTRLCWTNNTQNRLIKTKQIENYLAFETMANGQKKAIIMVKKMRCNYTLDGWYIYIFRWKSDRFGNFRQTNWFSISKDLIRWRVKSPWKMHVLQNDYIFFCLYLDNACSFFFNGRRQKLSN